MQTFLPYPDFHASSHVLDRQRLGKQRVEVLQILRALTDPDYGWQNHPAVQMWKGYEQALVLYGIAVCLEWTGRGYKDTCMEKIAAYGAAQAAEWPPWLGGPIHSSHRAALLHKDPEHYSRFGWSEEPVLDYVWPLKGVSGG